jgi:hypothetical protein
MVTIGLIVLAALCLGYIVYYGFQLLRPAQGLHRDGAPPLEPLPAWPEPSLAEWHTAPLSPGAQYYPPVYETAPEPDQRDGYLEQFDALMLANRMRFAAIHEFVDAGFSSILELEAA